MANDAADLELSAAFLLPHLGLNRKLRALTIRGTVVVRSSFPLDPARLTFLLGDSDANASVRIASARAKGQGHRTKLRLRIQVAMEALEQMPIHNALRLACASPDGRTATVRVRWMAALPKYLALHGPYYIDEQAGLTAFFRQNIDKNTMLTVRHVNKTDPALAHVKIGAAWALAKVARWIDPVILFEKNARHYEESARVVFEHLVDQGREDAWFVIGAEAAAALDIPGRYRKRLLVQHSFRHYLYFFRCTRFLGTEALPHSFELRCQSILVQRKLRSTKNRYVFLQHGVMYMVSLDSPERSFFRKRNMPGQVRIVASSELEARHFVELAGFDRSDIVVCGLPKFDRSYLNPGASKIVIMPTWRPWEFAAMRTDPESTKYAQLVRRMVKAVPPQLQEHVVVVPHPLFDPALFAPAGATAPRPAQTYDELLRDAALLVTDYSSISYDAFYRGANVVFYWEELEECLAHYGQPTRLMLDEQTAFGPVCRTPEELTAAIEQSYGAPQPPAYQTRYQDIVAFHDNRNTERLCEAIRGFVV